MSDQTSQTPSPDPSWVPVSQDDAPEAIPFDLRLSFTPDAIRDHFEGDEPDPTEGMTDEQLTEVGRTALADHGVYRAFHDALVLRLAATPGRQR
jgi:hypothetical protein